MIKDPTKVSILGDTGVCSTGISLIRDAYLVSWSLPQLSARCAYSMSSAWVWVFTLFCTCGH